MPDRRGIEIVDAATGEPLRTVMELEEARRREAADAATAQAQAGTLAVRADQAEAELRRLRERLRALGVDPDA